MISRAQTRANYDRLSRRCDLLAGSSERERLSKNNFLLWPVSDRVSSGTYFLTRSKYSELGLRKLTMRTGAGDWLRHRVGHAGSGPLGHPFGDGGRLGVVALTESGRPNLMQRLYVWAHRRFPAGIDCRPIPVADTLTEHSFPIVDATSASMWGLPVKIAVASKGTRTA